MAMTPQMRQVAARQAEWQDAWRVEDLADKDVTYMLNNPQGAIQLNLFEVEKVKKGKDFAKLKKYAVIGVAVGLGASFMFKKVAHVKFKVHFPGPIARLPDCQIARCYTEN